MKQFVNTVVASNTPKGVARLSTQACVMGKGYLGAMGMPHHRDVLIPQTVPRLDGVNIVNASAGWGHSSFVDEDGMLYVCGRTHDYRNTIRHIRSYQGIKVMVHSWNFINRFLIRVDFEPQVVMPGQTEEGSNETIFVKTACSPGDLTAGLTDDGQIFTLGANMHGQLGGGKISLSEYELQPVEPAIRPVKDSAVNEYEIDPFTDVSLGFQYGIALTESGKLWSWGKGGRGQLGQGDNETYKAPVQITGTGSELENVGWKVVNCGFSHAAAVTTDGTPFVWGRMRSVKPVEGRSERFAYDQWSPRHVELPSGTEIEDVACSQSNTAFLASDNSVWMMGFRGRGIQYDKTLGKVSAKDEYDVSHDLISEQDYLAQPIPVTRRPWEDYNLHVVKVYGGIHHTYAVCDDGSVWRWGWRRSPELVTPFIKSNFKVDEIRAGFNHLVAVGTFTDDAEFSDKYGKVENDNIERFCTT